MTKRQVECFKRIKRQWEIEAENCSYEITAKAIKRLQRDIWFLLDRIDDLRRSKVNHHIMQKKTIPCPKTG